MTWKTDGKQGNESGKIKWELVKWTRGKGLDVGCSYYKPFAHFIGVDNGTDIVKYGHQFRPDVWIDDAAKLNLFASESMDFVFSSHLLEHIEFDKVVATLREWLRVLKNDGYLILYLPDETLYPKIEDLFEDGPLKGKQKGNPDHKWNVSYKLMIELMEKAGTWDLLDWQRRDQDDEYSLFFVFQKKPKGHAFSCATERPQEPRAAVVRYGAFGDILQASSIFAGLKGQGYHVTVFCSPPGNDVILHDPNIDEFYLQDVNQVPNQDLGQFWDFHSKKYDMHTMPPTLRHRMLNQNYLEVQHEIAGVPHKPEVHFFPTEDEIAWAKREKEKLGGFTIVWAQSGSSVHKKWPWVDNVIMSMLPDFPDVNFVLVGGPDCILLEQGWFKVKDGEPVRDENGRRILADPRVLCTAGDWSIRQTMAFCQQADLIVGPETGVLNAVCQMPMPKIVMLSHSTDENLTRDWENTHVVLSNVTECPGRGKNEAPACHQLHYSWQFCKNAISPEDNLPMGIAQCMADIPYEHVCKVLWHVITHAKEARKAA
jgi:ADP-heptose:LPS heptosyltransferase/SAM-dependent methyltransferase